MSRSNPHPQPRLHVRPEAASPVQIMASLTSRESEVLGWLAEGKRDKEIATILGASVRTIHKHVQRILTKLGVETRTAAARVALDGRPDRNKEQPV